MTSVRQKSLTHTHKYRSQNLIKPKPSIKSGTVNDSPLFISGF